MGVLGGDDVMLMYQFISYYDIVVLREVINKRLIKEFENRFEEFGIMKNGILMDRVGDLLIFLSMEV